MKQFFTISIFLLLACTLSAQINKYLPVQSIKSTNDFVIIPEQRENPIHFIDSIFPSWLEKIKKPTPFQCTVQPGEYFVFQLVLVALNKPANDVKINFHNLTSPNGKIPIAAFTSFNTEGVDYKGNLFKKNVTIQKGNIQPLWIGLQIPQNANGLYESYIDVVINGEATISVPVQFNVKGDILTDGGISIASKLAKLQWLNSTAGINNKITHDFISLKRKQDNITLLGRRILLLNGLPNQITSSFTGNNSALSEKETQLLASPFQFVIELNDGTTRILKAGKFKYTSENESKIQWSITGAEKDIKIICNASVEFDGYMHYNIQVSAQKEVQLKDIYLRVEMPENIAQYVMGMGLKGGYCPSGMDWKWNVKEKNQDAIWLGNVNGGLRLKLLDENYRTPLINIYYKFGPLALPKSWDNEGKGGVHLKTENQKRILTAYSGHRTLHANDTLHFNFDLLVTPLKLFNTKKHFTDRYSQPKDNFSNPLATIKKSDSLGANIINVHHAKEVYPYINYPFNEINVKDLTNTIQLAHKQSKRLKVYYTTRELTVNLPEFWALNSLQGEVIFPGSGNITKTLIHEKPDQWLIDNLRYNYLPAWVHDFKEGRFVGTRDISVLTTPDSRLNNFYIGGLDWMCKNLRIDGVYIDDCALERTTLQRARKVLESYNLSSRMDLHSWNHFCDEGSWANCLNLYMDLLPYMDLVWIGEGRDYDEMPDHWLIEVCGIPFGVSGQMLQGGGNPYRGMLFGITNRSGWAKNGPEHIWKFWDDYKLIDKEMIGYWDKNVPVRTSSDLVKTTVFKGNKTTVVAIASWDVENTDILLNINWHELGLEPQKTKLYTPSIESFQLERNYSLNEKITVEKGKGLLLVLEE